MLSQCACHYQATHLHVISQSRIADTLAYLAAQAQKLQEPTAEQILEEDVSPEEIDRQWQLVEKYESRLRPQDAHRHVPFC